MQQPSSLLPPLSAPDASAAPAARTASSSGGIRVVGIGASAGGLEAMSEFLRNVPRGLGLSYVFVQHLDPTREGILAELLQRVTPLPVLQVCDRMAAAPDVVYVIPPDRDLSIAAGLFHLTLPQAPRGHRLPIDHFLESLARDQSEKSIAIILSGMGSDGTAGLRAIREKAGLILVQDPAAAKFDGMPRSAIAAGLADVVVPASEMPGRIRDFMQSTATGATPPPPPPEAVVTALERVITLLRSQTGHDFTHYKRTTLLRRVERRMGIHQCATVSDYLARLEENAQERELLFKELLIGVTSFFRDAPVWEELSNLALPELIEARPTGHVFRIWVPACSSGEEAYSLAILFTEALEALRPGAGHRVLLFATDLDSDAIATARRGLFPRTIGEDVTPARLERFFIREDTGYRVRREIRECVIFAVQNLIMDPPFTKLDLVSCRNLLIYLTSEVQKKLAPLFHYSLAAGGLLVLGSAETLGGFPDLFVALPGRSRLYRRRAEVAARISEFPSTLTSMLPLRPEPPSDPVPPVGLQAQADRLILQNFAPAAVLVREKGDIVCVSGRTGAYLEPAAGKANWNIFAMARAGLRHELGLLFRQALEQDRPVTVRNVQVELDAMEPRVDLTATRLSESGALQGLVLILFAECRARAGSQDQQDSRPPTKRTEPMEALQQQLQAALAETQELREAMQSSQEELRSMNEELHSANEELQSANEELTTSKEEMQSLNEELQTVNQELQTKVDDLSRTSDNMENLLNSTRIATIFLHTELQIRRFTPQATKIIRLIPGDIGRPLTDVTSSVPHRDLVASAREVLRTLAGVETPMAAEDGRWFTVRTMPYRTTDQRVEGVVITFFDITEAKRLEAKLRGDHHALARESHATPDRPPDESSP